MLRSLLATLTVSLCLAPAAQAQSKIQPGAMLQTEVGQCTLNFIYDGIGAANAGKVYVGTAAHCGDKVGQAALDESDQPFGTFAFIANENDAAFDYAFIEVAPEHHSRVDPALKGHPAIPVGVTTPEETKAGDLIQMSGYGIGFGLTQPTQERRQTVLQSDDADIFTLSGPSVNGDSGGPFVHIPTGKALGLVSMYGFTHAATDVGPTIQGVLAKAAKAGFPVSLRAAGQPAPAAPERSPETQPQPAPSGEPASAGSSDRGSSRGADEKKAKKSKRQRACEKKAKKIKKAKKRRAAMKRCAKRG